MNLHAHLDKGLLLKILIITILIGLALFPWSNSSSYGNISGFDKSNVYIKPEQNFIVETEPNQLDISGSGPNSEVIHLALSDLPFTSSFKITLKSALGDFNPVTVSISYPLIKNRLETCFFPKIALFTFNNSLMKERSIKVKD